MHLLLVEDDPRLADLVARLLGGERHLVERATTGAAALEMAGRARASTRSCSTSACPDLSGLEVARTAAATAAREVPILMLTARDAVSDRVAGPGRRRGRLPRQAVRDRGARGAGAGAGPPGPRAPAAQTTLVAGPIQLDEATRIVTVDGLRVDLSPREFALLECLLRHRGQVLSRDQLLDHAWPYDTEVVPGDRRHLRLLPAAQAGAGRGRRRIETVRGMGYRVAA